MQKICKTYALYARNMQEICKIYAKNKDPTRKICKKYVQNMQKKSRGIIKNIDSCKLIIPLIIPFIIPSIISFNSSLYSSLNHSFNYFLRLQLFQLFLQLFKLFSFISSTSLPVLSGCLVYILSSNLSRWCPSTEMKKHVKSFPIIPMISPLTLVWRLN